jgi:hypothetical protein
MNKKVKIFNLAYMLKVLTEKRRKSMNLMKLINSLKKKNYWWLLGSGSQKNKNLEILAWVKSSNK